MKKLPKVHEFNVTINNQEFTLDIRESERSKIMSNCLIYSCMTFTSDMVPVKRFNLVYNMNDKTYWAWTMDAIRESDRIFRESIAELLNNKTLKLVA
jgi:hypothetical protein